GWLYLAMLVALLVGAVAWAVVVARNTRGEDPKWYGDMVFGVWLSVAALTTFAIIITLTSLPDVVSALYNPEYWALKQIIGCKR
ncbi:MAG: hypothetical protein ACRC1H_02200, partial [Caldilineaceae bacterium]